jgi:Fur family ferric uptake transcriptional regulator
MSCNTILKEKGLRMTPQRRLILDIVDESGGHMTGEEIVRIVQSKMPGVNKSTVYRTLELLEKLECVCKSESGDRYIYHHAEEGHHHHLVCSKCNKTVDCDEDLFTPVEKALRSKYGFNVDFKHIVIKGVCENCNKKSK